MSLAVVCLGCSFLLTGGQCCRLLVNVEVLLEVLIFFGAFSTLQGRIVKHSKQIYKFKLEVSTRFPHASTTALAAGRNYICKRLSYSIYVDLEGYLMLPAVQLADSGCTIRAL
jgi:hypothetical protein